MKRRFTLVILGISAFLAFLPQIVLKNSAHSFPKKEEHENTGAYSADGDDDPVDRYLWEQMRTADPATGRIPENIRARELAFARTLPVAHAAYKNLSDWQSIGPSNVGGRTRALALDVTNPNIILAGGATGGMWRSTDAGKSWKRTTLPSTLRSVSCLTQDTRAGKTNNWYYGTGEYYGGYVISGDGIFKSTDSGKSWKPFLATNRPNGFSATDYIWNIAVNTTNTKQDEVLMAAYGGIYRSIYGGDSFRITLGGGSSLGGYSSATDIAISPKGMMYATLSSDGPSNQRGIWRSTDGVHWTNITPASWPKNYGRVVIGIAPSNENTVYFLANTPGYGLKGLRFDSVADWNSLWKYSYLNGDGSGAGGSWDDRSLNLPAYFQTKGYRFGDFNTQQGYDMVVKVKPDDENVVFIGATNLYRSDDGFATKNKIYWIGGYNTVKSVVQDYTYKGHHPDQHNLFFLPGNPKVLYSSNDGGIFRTDNCLDTVANWVSLNNGYINTQFYSIALNHHSILSHPYSDMILGGLQDNQSWSLHVNSDPSKAWDKWTRGDGGHCALVDNDTATFMFTSVQKGVVIMDAFDKTGKRLGWKRVDPIGGSGYLFINPFCLDANNGNTLYQAAGEYIWRNDSTFSTPLTNKNDSITRGWKRLDVSRAQGYTITALSSSTSPSNILYYGTNRGKIYKLSNANTANPVRKDISSAKDFLTNMYVSCIAVDPEDANKIIAVFSNYNIRSLFFSPDGGTSWQDISGNLEENPNGSGAGPSCRWAKIVHVPKGETLFLVGTSTGLYMTNKLNGTSTVWEQQGADEIGNTVVEMIDARPSDGLVVAATYGSGVFTSSIYSLADIPKDKTAVSQFILDQNYPNPATDVTDIPFSLPASTEVSLQILDISGREVYALPAQKIPTGEHHFQVPLDRFGKGIYFYRVQAGKDVQTRKMLKQN